MTDTAANARPFGIRDKIGYALGMLVFPFKYTEAGASVDVLSIVIWTVLLMIANVGNGLFGVIVWAMVVDCIPEHTDGSERRRLYLLPLFFLPQARAGYRLFSGRSRAGLAGISERTRFRPAATGRDRYKNGLRAVPFDRTCGNAAVRPYRIQHKQARRSAYPRHALQEG